MKFILCNILHSPLNLLSRTSKNFSKVLSIHYFNTCTMRLLFCTMTNQCKITGPSLGAKAKFLCINRTQSRAVTGLLTGHNTLRGHLHLMGLSDSPLCRRCGAEDETSANILCECEALASLRHVYLGSFCLEPEDITSILLGAIWSFSKATGLP